MAGSVSREVPTFCVRDYFERASDENEIGVETGGSSVDNYRVAGCSDGLFKPADDDETATRTVKSRR